MIELSQFGFGKTDSSNSSEYYESLMNNYGNKYDPEDEYALWSNTSSLAMNFRGLGLPRDSFLAFENLLAVLANG